MVRGLSPRGRGNQPAPLDAGQCRGSIPAWAGKPPGRSCRNRAARVYPRVGGETALTPLPPPSGTGLSPRGRGNPLMQRGFRQVRRSIPAWAGKPPSWRSCRARRRVYPRVGGETRKAPSCSHSRNGLSPRGRGNPSTSGLCRRWSGSIPAWAGKPSGASAWDRARRVYPRVGGETSTTFACPPSKAGLSPRGRGNHDQPRKLVRLRRSIPAWAGKPKATHAGNVNNRVYPRVGGETSGGRDASCLRYGLSPRGRGNPSWLRCAVPLARSIPAWAGKPGGPRRPLPPSRVYPRVGGETPSGISSPQGVAGLSPRGRGNLDHGQHQSVGLATPRGRGNPRPSREARRCLWSIPAWAGKPQYSARSTNAQQGLSPVGGETPSSQQ